MAFSIGDGRSLIPLVTDIVQVMRENKLFKSDGRTKPLRVRILRNYSAEFIEPFLAYYFHKIGIGCQIEFGGFDTINQDALDDKAFANCDLVVVAQVFEGLEPDADLKGFNVDDTLARVTGLAESIAARCSAPIILNTFLRPVAAQGGPALALREGALDRSIAEMNQRLRLYVADRMPRCLLVDCERLLMQVGADAAIDRRMRYLANAPFKHAYLSAYAHEICRMARMLFVAGKKCLILDCDNTLWGGIVGEVGPQEIELDRNNYPGRAFYDFQKSVVRLAGQGVMIALCSKNNLEDVMAVLDEHPHCLLKREHLVGYRINWQDKETNIQELVEELNIGMDAVVFVDDNPAECARIEAFLPALTVRQVPKALYDLPYLLDSEGLFDRLSVSKEDLKRTKLYQDETRRREVAAKFATVDEFLASLDLRMEIKHANAPQVARISQLTQKTNQFNLTTRRYSEADIARLISDENYAVFTLAASDRYGDMGLSGVLIAAREGERARVDTLLMSCRILGRKLENQFVASCLKYLSDAWRPRAWHAEYVESRKNRQVVGFWPSIGFAECGKVDATTRYSGEQSSLKLENVPFIRVEMS